MDYSPLSQEVEEIGTAIVDAAYKVHRTLGPGLLENIYEVCLTHELSKAGYTVKSQVKLPIIYDGIKFDEGLQIDLLVENKVIIELKAVDQVNPVWKAQIISHLRLAELDLGFLINFNVEYIKNGIKRYRV